MFAQRCVQDVMSGNHVPRPVCQRQCREDRVYRRVVGERVSAFAADRDAGLSQVIKQALGRAVVAWQHAKCGAGGRQVQLGDVMGTLLQMVDVGVGRITGQGGSKRCEAFAWNDGFVLLPATLPMSDGFRVFCEHRIMVQCSEDGVDGVEHHL